MVKASEGYQYLIDETPKTIKTIDENTVDGLNVIEHRLDKALEETKKADDEVEKVASDSKTIRNEETDLENKQKVDHCNNPFSIRISANSSVW